MVAKSEGWCVKFEYEPSLAQSLSCPESISPELLVAWYHSEIIFQRLKILNWFSSSWARESLIGKNISNAEALINIQHFKFLCLFQLLISSKIKTLPQFTSWWVDYFSVRSVIALLMSSNFQTRPGTRRPSRQRAAPAV